MKKVIKKAKSNTNRTRKHTKQHRKPVIYTHIPSHYGFAVILAVAYIALYTIT